MTTADVPPDLKVGVNFLVVPDGLRIVAGRTLARLSVSLTPRLDPPAWMPTVDLRHWPTDVHDLTRTLRLAVGRVASTGQFTVTDPRWVKQTFGPDVAGLDAARFAQRADRLWRRIFMAGYTDEDQAFRALKTALARGEKDGVPKMPVGDWRYGSYSVAGLSRVIDALYTGVTGAAVLGRLRQGGGAGADGAHAARAEAPGIAAWKRLQLDWLGIGPADDPVNRLAVRPRSTESGAVVREMQDLAKRLAGDSVPDHLSQMPLALETETAQALAQVAQFFLARAADERFWQTGADTSGLSPEALEERQRVLRREVARFSECWNLGWQPVLRSADDQDQDDAAGAPGRKYGAIQSYPTLAKFLGFIVDVEVPLDVVRPLSRPGLGDRAYGAFLIEPAPATDPATWTDPPIAGRLWTTFVHRPAAGADPGYFGPCLAAEAAGGQPTATGAFKEGVLDLTIPMGDGGQPRFVLQTLDATNGVHALRQDAREVAYRHASGLAASRISTTLPETRSRGIELIDHRPQSAGIAEADRERAARLLQDRDDLPLLKDVDGLVVGYRIDAALASKDGGGWRAPARWRPLMARRVEYRARLSDGTYDYRDIPPEYLALAGVTRHTARDDGHTRMMTGSTEVQEEAPDTPIEPPPPSGAGGGRGKGRKLQTVAHGQVFTWTGQSLGVSAPAERLPNAPPTAADCRTVWPDPEKDLAIDLEIDLPRPPKDGGVDHRPAPLREGRRYMFGARLCLVNGCGVTFEDARPRYTDPVAPVVLGTSPTEPFWFRRRERIEAPDVLLPWNDRLVKDPLSEWPGERIDVLVIRSGDVKETNQAARFLVPARVSFDLAEQGGVFDASAEDRPRGAFANGAHRASLDPKTGTFPVARDGRWEFPKLKDPTDTTPVPAEPAREPSRGAVFVLASGGRRPEIDFYPDSLGRRADAQFRRVNNETVQPAHGFGGPSRVAFWGPADPGREAEPILLALKKPAGDRPTRFRGYFDETDQHEILFRHPLPLPVRVKKLAVVLGPAETVDLEITSAPDLRDVLARHEVFRSLVPALQQSFAAMKSAWRRNGAVPADLDQIEQGLADLAGPNAEQAFDEILRLGRLATLQTARYVRLVHAVQRPLKPPRFLVDGKGRLRVHPVVVTVAAEDQSTNELKSWTRFVEAQEAVEPDPLNWPSAPGGTTAFFVGAVQVHRASTGAVRCEARWKEFGPESERYDAQAGVWDDRAPFQYARLFEITHVPTTDATPDPELDLLREDDGGKLRALSYAFRDAKARRVSLVLLATSRFTGFFPPAPPAVSGQVGPYEAESSRFEESRDVLWVPATARPAAPQVDKVLPVFRWTVSGRRGGNELSFRRETTLRVHLKRPWHSSGEDEMLGVVCWPPNLVGANPDAEAKAADEAARETICDLETAMGPLSRFVTRWGADPIRLSGQLDHLISADRFSDFDAKASNLLLTLATDPADAPVRRRGGRADDAGTKRVSVLGYRPKLDRAEGVWTCDVTVDHGAAYFPFIQLGLVRYQPHALAGLELSTPVAHVGQIPPRREGRVVFTSDRELVLEVHGVGFRRSETGDVHKGQRHDTDVPLLNVRLLRAHRETRIPHERDGSIRWHRVVDPAGQPVEQLRLRPIQKGPEVWWTCKVTLPESRRWVDYGLLVEEVELMAADRQRVPETAPACGSVEFFTELEERGPLFAHIVDLRT